MRRRRRSTTSDVLWLTLGDPTIASSRVRAYAISDHLNGSGINSTAVVGAGARGRVRAMIELIRRRPRVVVIQKLLYGRVMLGLVSRFAGALVFECDDAVHLGYPGESARSGARSRVRLRRALSRAVLVTTSSPLLARDFATGPRRVIWYPGPAPPIRKHERPRTSVLLWLGSPSTAKNLQLIPRLPARLGEKGWTCVAVGAPSEYASLGWKIIDWSPESAEHWLGEAAVGIMPQRAGEWDDRKAAYKVLEYAAAGVIPVASDVIPARTILSARLPQLLVRDEGGWIATILAGASARRTLEPELDALSEAHSVARCTVRWLDAVRASVERPVGGME